MSPTGATGYLTSFAELFDPHPDDRPAVQRIEIPLMQRDYAQGRENPKTTQIRSAFLTVLHEALTGGRAVNLDFVYGRVHKGTLRPLDGQQRLTTLFLLHWYLAVRSGLLDAEHGWKNFSYDTRPAARVFISQLLKTPPMDGELPTDAWVRNQPWFLHVWRHSPSVEGMVVMIRSIHEVFRDVDPAAAWANLMNRQTRPISFYLLPLDEMRSDENLYITMNSRGKPLTEFETFKARFEDVISWSPALAQQFRQNIDSRWADVMWPYRGEDENVDDEYLRYIEYVIELCEWKQGRTQHEEQLITRARQVFGEDAGNAEENARFLIHALETWVAVDDIETWFGDSFQSSRGVLPDGTDRLRLFPGQTATDLFGACCQTYDARNRPFTLAQGLLLYAVLIHRQHHTDNIHVALRQLRNLLSSSGDEVRVAGMPQLLRAVDALILHGALEHDGPGFSTNQVADELAKEAFRHDPSLRPHLHALEDHDLLRGRLAVFDLDPQKLAARQRAFTDLFHDDSRWPGLSGVLLTFGQYHRRTWEGGKGFWFGSGMEGEDRRTSWRRILTSASHEQLGQARQALMRLLDAYANHVGDRDSFLQEATSAWLREQQDAKNFTWRYYMVRYPSMRQTASGLYITDHGELGYQMCMMRVIRLNSWYRDPYLTTMCRESTHATSLDQMFTGYETTPRWLRLPSETGIRCVDQGFALEPPSDIGHRRTFDEVTTRTPDIVTTPAEEDGEEDRFLLAVHQITVDDTLVDAEDRIRKGASLLDSLLQAGL